MKNDERFLVPVHCQRHVGQVTFRALATAGSEVMPNVDSFEERIRWCFVAAYIADAVGLLDQDKQIEFTHLAEQHAGEATWHDVVEQDLGIKKSLIASIFKNCRKCMGIGGSLCFILRGLGCPYPEARLREVVGDKLDD